MDERQETASLVTNKGMLILKKMGFEERIGRFGDGPLHPISLKKLSESINSEFESNIPPVNPSCTYPDKGKEQVESHKTCMTVFSKRRNHEIEILTRHVDENCLVGLPHVDMTAIKRGFVIDFDLIILNQEKRKYDALIETFGLSSDDKERKDILFELCKIGQSDGILLQKAFECLFHVPLAEDELQSLFEHFESNIVRQSLQKNELLISVLKELTRKSLRCVGFLHRGSRWRMNEEFIQVGIREQQFCKYSVALDLFAHEPYDEQWSELCRRLGVNPHHSCCLLLSQRESKPSPLELGSLVSHLKPLKWNADKNTFEGEKDVSPNISALLLRIENELVKQPEEVFEEPKNVVARYSLDGLWYAAYAKKCLAYESFWVTYIYWQNSELVDKEHVQVISRKVIEYFQSIDYRGIDNDQKQILLRQTNQEESI